MVITDGVLIDLAMRTLLAFALLLSACTYFSSDDVVELEPDARGTVVYPCAVPFYETCQAAKAAAEVVCDKRYRCDDLYDVPREQCVAGVMEDLCAQTACNSPDPYDRAELDACLAGYAATACEMESPRCHL